MSLFDQPYYALTKTHMSRIGMWPGQSKYARIVRPLAVFVLVLSLTVPRLLRWNELWKDTAPLVHDIPILVAVMAIFASALRLIQHFNEIKLAFENMERHWEVFVNTSAVVVLEKYAESGRHIVLSYTIWVYMEVAVYWFLCLSPIILDVIDPINETRAKIYFLHTEYGVDKEKYYWFIVVHEYIVTMMAVAILMAMETMYFTWAVHACALFEVVGFAELVENVLTGPMASALCFLSISIVFTGVQALINSQNRNVLVQSAIYIIAQIFHLYINTIPGQELMNHSERIHTTAYDMTWSDMSVKAQKLLIPIMIRSNKPCCFTARKVYVLSMENFGSTLRTVMSYFTIFAQMI